MLLNQVGNTDSAKIRIFLNLGSYCDRELNARVKEGVQEVLGVCGMVIGSDACKT